MNLTMEWPMYRSILIPLDGSPLSEQAVPLAQELARRTGAALCLAHGHIPPTVPMYTADLPLFDAGLDDLTRAQERAYLEALAARIRGAIDIPVAAALLEGAITDSVADLIAMATHGRRGLVRLLIGSVADKVLRGATTPILLYRPQVQTERGVVEERDNRV
jgi:nucleotide-binding universal stress UspA family protein